MSLQTGEVAMIALGVDAEPSLPAGVHLRWSVDPVVGFPPFGFDIFRRAHRLGTQGLLDFTGEALRDLPASAELGPITLTAADPLVPSRIGAATTPQAPTVLRPGGRSALTGRFAPALGPLRRVELELVHWSLPAQPQELTMWGIAGNRRVAKGAVTLTRANDSQVLTVAVLGDALDGFQVLGGVYGILRIRWTLVADEALLGWAAPLNSRRIGLPVTAPGYLVRHAHSPDAGAGAEDWQEAADRLSPTGNAAGLPPALAARYGPPTFTGTRTLMRQALTGQPLVAQPAAAKPHRVQLDPVEVTLLASLDPDLARLLGLAVVDRTAAVGTRYDYRVTGYWPGQLRPQLVCRDVPAGGTQIPTGTSITLPAEAGGSPVVVTAETGTVVAEPAATLSHARTVITGAWSGDGERLLCVPADGLAQLWNADGGRVGQLDTADAVLGAAWGGARLATWTRHGVAQIWTAEGRPVTRLDAQRVVGVAWGKEQLASWSEDGTARLWTGDGKPGPVLDAPELAGLTWGPGNTFASWSRDGSARIWTPDGGLRTVLDAPEVLGAAWAGDTLVTWSREGTARLWTTAGDLVATLPESQVIGAAGGALGRLVSWSRDGTARLWARDGAPISTLDATAVVGAAWSGDGTQLALWSRDGVGRLSSAAGAATVALPTDVAGGSWGGGGNRLVTWSGTNAATWNVGPPLRSLAFHLGDPTDQVQITGRCDGPEPLAVRALAGQTVVGVGIGQPGASTQVTLDAPGTTSVVVTGTNLTVMQICRTQLIRDLIERTWICFAIAREPVPPLDPPGLTGRALPGFARDNGAEQVIGLTLDPAPPPTSTGLLPRARTARDTAVYDVARRADGNAPILDPAVGAWVDLPAGGAGTQARILTRTSHRPAGHRSPSGWPDEPQDLFDDTIDPAVRFYSYRVRGRDLFGRQSDWSAPLSVDAADRVGPPPPAALTARHLDSADPWLDADDVALLPVGGGSAVRLRWSWPRERAEQAPDAAFFRVYWHPRPFSTVTADIATVAADPAGYRLQATLRHPPTTLPADAFRGDWLRQGNRQWLVLANTAANPTTLLLSALDADAPEPGPAAITLRPPDPQRLDLLGNPLRADPTDPRAWDQRVHEAVIARTNGSVIDDAPGVGVTVQQVLMDQPRDGAATVTLAPGWRWSGSLPGPWRLDAGGTTWTVTGVSLGGTATLVVDAPAGPPPPGNAVLRDTAGTVHTLRMDVNPPTSQFQPIGGTVWTGAATLAVLAHRAIPNGAELAVALPAGTGTPASLSWTPDHEYVLSAPPLPVTAAEPHATGTVGVSVVDGRPYAADPRGLPNEPTGPGNEGPVASITVTRAYRGAPTAQPTPAGSTGQTELWAAVPDEFSGTSRFLLRWPAAGGYRFIVLHATLDAVLDADQSDAAAGRGAYAGQGPLTGTALAAWRAQQAQLGAQASQQLATAQPAAFAPLATGPLLAADPRLTDPQPGWLRWPAPIDGAAPGRHFLCVRAADEAGNAGRPGPATLPIVVPDMRRPPPPRLRGGFDGDRRIWLQWDVSPGATEYRVYRSQAAGSSEPDIRDMALLATLGESQCPEPAFVFGGAAHLSGAAPSFVIAVYRAEDYDPALAPDAQVAAPLPGTFVPVGGVIGGLSDLPDASLVFVVVRYAAGGTLALAAPATGRAYRDSSVEPGRRYQYRVLAVREAAVGPSQTMPVRSFPSEVRQAEAFDTRPPVPPQGTATWSTTQQAVQISWNAGVLPPTLQVLVQRTEHASDMWRSVTTWLPASTGSAQDATGVSGRSYLYRLRVRNAGRTSAAEPSFGPIPIP